jgi:hypothetical protein
MLYNCIKLVFRKIFVCNSSTRWLDLQFGSSTQLWVLKSGKLRTHVLWDVIFCLWVSGFQRIKVTDAFIFKSQGLTITSQKKSVIIYASVVRRRWKFLFTFRQGSLKLWLLNIYVFKSRWLITAGREILSTVVWSLKNGKLTVMWSIL